MKAGWLPVIIRRQARVDQFLDEVRGGSTQQFSHEAHRPFIQPDVVGTAGLVADLLRVIGDRLANDTIMVTLRAAELQAFDLAAQTLKAIRTQPVDASRIADAAAACAQLRDLLKGTPTTPCSKK